MSCDSLEARLKCGHEGNLLHCSIEVAGSGLDIGLHICQYSLNPMDESTMQLMI